MNALATIRHGPVIIISDTLGEDPTTYLPLNEMTDILHGNPNTHPSPHAPYLPPIYILNRTTINPPHFDASKPAPRIETTPTAPNHLDPTAEPTLKLNMIPPPPTIQRQPHHPELNFDWDAPQPPSNQTFEAHPPPEDLTESQEPLTNQPYYIPNQRSTSPPTRRRPQALITSTPPSNTNRSPHKVTTTIASKKRTLGKGTT